MKNWISAGLKIAALGVAVAAAGGTGAFAQTAPLPAIFAGGEVGQGIYIDASDLATLEGNPGLKLIDIRPADAYAAGHLPGAINIPNTILSVEANGLLNQVPEQSALEAIFSAAGLSYDDTIVIYGDNLAGRSFIAFDQSGFPNLHILAGGFPDWTGDVSTEAATPVATDFHITQPKFQIVDKAYVLAHLNTPGVFIIDSRDAASFNAGYIPGSFNIPTALTNQGAEVLPVDQLVAALEAIGVTKDSEIITTCGTGNLASNQLAVLRDLGYTNIKLYDGSWTEWSADPTLPKATNPPV